MVSIRNQIEITGEWDHLKASESYVAVEFTYPECGVIWDGAVPTEYRRGPNIKVKSEDELSDLLEKVYEFMHPYNENQWQKKQDYYWKDKREGPTKNLFDSVRHCEWICARCAMNKADPGNPNWARRWQDLKESGYTTATIPSHVCDECLKRKIKQIENDENLSLLEKDEKITSEIRRKSKSAKIIMLRYPREEGIGGYEVIPPKVRKNIMESLKYFDAYENQIRRKGLLPDHKFPEIRWDKNTIGMNTLDMTKDEMKEKFQLMTNRRNQQKREVCRKCYQTGERGSPFGINHWYSGDRDWPTKVPIEGLAAEKGCYGCGWYDLQAWRDSLNDEKKNSLFGYFFR